MAGFRPKAFPGAEGRAWRWIPPGIAVDVAGIAIPDGMIYLGSDLLAAGGSVEPSLIDPALPVAGAAAAALLPARPAWSALSEEQRRSHLGWLAEGRRAAGADPGCALLFLYGLERRLVAERRLVGAAEADALIAEVRALLAVYGGHRSFARAAWALLDAAEAAHVPCRLHECEPGHGPYGDGPSLRTRVALGQLVEEEREVPAEWLAAWWMDVRGRDASIPSARRAEAQAAAVEALIEDGRRGVRLRPGKRTMGPLTHRAASGAFAEDLGDLVKGLPDIAALSAPLDAVDGIIGAAVAGFAGAAPEADEPAEADGLGARVAAWTPRGHALVAVADLLDAADLRPAAANGRLSRAECRLLGERLARHGFGMEPDPETGGPNLVYGGEVCLFRSGDAAPSPSFAHAALLVGVAAAVSATDAGLDGGGREAAVLAAAERMGLARQGDAARLYACLRWSLAHPQDAKGLKGRLAGLAEAERAVVARDAARMAAEVGGSSRAAVALAQDLYRVVGLDERDCFADLHAVASGEAPAAKRFRIPPRPAPGGAATVAASPAPGPVALDASRIASVLADTRRASRALGDVFVEDEHEPGGGATAVAPQPSPAAARFPGLAAAHAALLERLLAEDGWERAAYEAMAREAGVLPDGAIEAINEWAFERFDAPLIEDGDPLVIDRSLVA